MRVRVLLFGPLAEIYGVREEWVDLGPAPSARDVFHHYQERDARIGDLDKSLHVAVNQTIVPPDHPLSLDDEVALLPPVCGGSEGDDLIELTDQPLETQRWRKHLVDAAGRFGAATTFEGLVRQEDANDPVLALSFDAYRPMAITALHTLASEARQRWTIEKIVLIHRLGIVPAGEVCVVVGVTTGHREEAFAACKFLIDILKATVPIWKQELTASSSRWVEGSLLPASAAATPVRK